MYTVIQIAENKTTEFPITSKIAIQQLNEKINSNIKFEKINTPFFEEHLIEEIQLCCNEKTSYLILPLTLH